MNVIESLRGLNLVKYLPLTEHSLDVARVVGAGWNIGEADFDEHLDLAEILELHAEVAVGLFDLAEADRTFYSNLIQTIQDRLREGRGSLFAAYMRGVLRDKRIVRSYQSMSEAFPPGSVSKGDQVNLLFRLGSHLAVEYDRSMIARETVHALNAKINSILESDDAELMEIIEFTSKFLGD